MKSFPVIYQHDAMQCGIACLQMVCQYYGRTYSMEAISNFCHATTEGVSMLGISEASENLGIESVSAKVSVEKLTKAPMPCILHWSQSHFVVLYRVKKGREFYIADPAKGLVNYSIDEFCRHWVSITEDGEEKGVAMFLEPTEEFYHKDIPMRKENHSISFLMKYFRQYQGQLLMIALTLILGSMVQLVLPFLTQQIVDTGIKNRDIDFIWLIQ